MPLTTMERDKLIAGVDEVGRGPLAGNVVAAAVILDNKNCFDGLKDSKKLSFKKRELFAKLIQEQALAWAIGKASAAEIDTLNILQASLLAMKRAVDALSVCPDEILIDGNQVFDSNIPRKAIVRGDQLVLSISAASVIAKVERDREMTTLAKQYPEYGFEKHKGYPTSAHIKAIQIHGVCSIHRKSFRRVKEYC